MVTVATANAGSALKVTAASELRRLCMMGLGDTYYRKGGGMELLASAIENTVAELAQKHTIVDIIVDARQRAPKPETAIKALALVISLNPTEAVTEAQLVGIKNYAWSKLGDVVRNGSHMLTFVRTLDQYRGWGRSVQRNIGNWYTSRRDLGFQLTKYQSRTIDGETWAQRDVLALAFGLTKGGRLSPTPKFSMPSQDVHEILQWAHGDVDLRPEISNRNVDYIRAVQKLPTADEAEIVSLIEEFAFPWEVIPSEKRTAAVWEALIPHMGGMAFYRNIATMTNAGVDGQSLILRMKTLSEHPLNILTALYVYRMGRGVRSAATWQVDDVVKQALEDAFYRSFEYAAPTNVPQLVALDVSSSMKHYDFNGIAGLNARVVSAVLAMVLMRSEKTVQPDMVAFSTELVDFPMTPQDSLETVIKTIERIKFGDTLTSLPLQYILDNNKEYSAYTVYTDMQTSDHNTSKLLEQVREKMPLRMVEVSMVPNALTFTSSPMDLSIAGFSADLPALINTFITL